MALFAMLEKNKIAPNWLNKPLKNMADWII